ncbi:hypothetical protein CFC21_036311 [Triticum aestivum]|uniref:Uncharacterized protein n=2 Tax=Triticum aestivum TaxID=4565 RepID=A0A9R1F9C4_WHEAT|nr:uncharacterized protein LOC123185089 [Triticum aestivum]KAF7000385.1 hypothetical protein CFC21_016305 [Triticum aestivum]KAF7023882.1 hypothetical protein CFC21_036311 [Triticum aestivum]
MDRRPPLAVSPRRLRPRPSHAAAGRPPLASSVHIPSPGFSKKAQTPMRSSICALPPPSSYSSYLETSPRPKPDFAAATRAAGKENLHFQDADDGDEAVPFNLADASTDDWAAAVAPTSPLFERGRLYDLYSARRNERLKRKHGWYAAGEEEAGAMAEDPCVAVELSKRRGAKKAAGAPESAVRRSMPAAAAAEFSQSYRAGGGLSAMRSSLRSSKEMKKPSAASSCATAAKPSTAKGRRVGSQSSVRRI